MHTILPVPCRGIYQLQHFGRAVPSKRSFQSPSAGRMEQSTQHPAGAWCWAGVQMEAHPSPHLTIHQPLLLGPGPLLLQFACCSAALRDSQAGVKSTGWLYVCIHIWVKWQKAIIFKLRKNDICRAPCKTQHLLQFPGSHTRRWNFMTAERMQTTQQQIYPSHEQNQTNSYISSARQGYPHNECGEGVHTVCLWVLCHPLFPQTQAFTKLLSMPDVLAAWHIGTQTLRRWNHKGKFSLLPTSKNGDLSSIFSFLQSRRKVQLHQPSQVRGYSC